MNTYWFHGSPKKLKVLKRKKAQAPLGRPPQESLNVIYLTPDFAFAMACAVTSRENRIEVDHSQKTIRFEVPNEFNPGREIYIYSVDPLEIPKERVIWMDPWQVAVDMNELVPVKREKHKAGEVLEHYKLLK